jgi:hypothetical protein
MEKKVSEVSRGSKVSKECCVTPASPFIIRVIDGPLFVDKLPGTNVPSFHYPGLVEEEWLSENSLSSAFPGIFAVHCHLYGVSLLALGTPFLNWMTQFLPLSDPLSTALQDPILRSGYLSKNRTQVRFTK